MSKIGFLLVLATAVLTMTANLLLRAGIDAAGGFALGSGTQVLHALVRLFMQPLFTLGFAIYFLASVVWFRVVATEPLSLAYPILVSLTFALVTGGAVLIFSEPVSLRKVVGLAVILAGIVIVALE
jgi:multidrug transporter EmrE-like cation transporter